MPRFRTHVLSTTFYLYRHDEKTGKKIGPCGTGVLISASSAVPGAIDHLYAVTALHVVQGGGSIIRLNTSVPDPSVPSGLTLGTRDLDFEPHEWVFNPEAADLAAIDVTASIGAKGDLASSVPVSDFVTMQSLPALRITMGEDVFMVGLFTGNPGTTYNQTATRFGNIAQLADLRHPLLQGHGKERPSHVIDMHSRPGFSGSPVFVYRTPGNDLTAIDQAGNFHLDLQKPNSAFVKFLGIHSGQFQESLGDGRTIPSSMTVVVPAWDVKRLLEYQVFDEQRIARDEEWRRRPESHRTVIPEVAEAEPEIENPSAKEDFMNLLGAAARSKKQAS